MKRALLAISLLTLTAQAVPWQQARPIHGRPVRQIRVRVQRAETAIEVSGVALRVSGSEGVRPAALVIGKPVFERARISRDPGGTWKVRWSGRRKSENIQSGVLKLNGQGLKIGDDHMPQRLEIYPNARRGLDVVAAMDLETYLYGVLPSEMPASWPLEALKAQAVASRTFALRMLNERGDGRHFDIDSTVIDQVYTFLHESTEDARWRARLEQALMETRDQVLLDERGRLLKAFYSADCGCQSEDPRFVWGSRVTGLQSVQDPSCEIRPAQTWSVSFERAEIRKRLLAGLQLPKDIQLKTVHLKGKTPSGRVDEVIALFDTQDGEVLSRSLSAQEFRRIFGFSKVKSASFGLRWYGSTMEINGEGLGHGVGLCQTGARTMAEGGQGYKAILKRYYPRAKTPIKTKSI